MEEQLLSLIKKLSELLMSDGTVFEEVIDMLVAAGATVSILKKIGFTEDQIWDYAYYVSVLDDISQEDAYNNIPR